MFIMNEQGMNDLMSGHFKVGARMCPRPQAGWTRSFVEGGWKAGILTYSSSKGAFIGASLNGAELQQDQQATREWYGHEVPFKEIPGG